EPVPRSTETSGRRSSPSGFSAPVAATEGFASGRMQASADASAKPQAAGVGDRRRRRLANPMLFDIPPRCSLPARRTRQGVLLRGKALTQAAIAAKSLRFRIVLCAGVLLCSAPAANRTRANALGFERFIEGATQGVGDAARV